MSPRRPPHRATFVDRAFATLDGPTQPMDCAIILAFPSQAAPTLAFLEEGKLRALDFYSKSACVLHAEGWLPAEDLRPGLREARFEDETQARSWMAQFLERRFRCDRDLLLEEALIVTPTLSWLVLRMHHALADLVSAVAWLQKQLQQTRVEAPPEPPPEPLTLARYKRRVRRSRFAFEGPADALARGPDAQSSGRRLWQTVSWAKPSFLGAPVEKQFSYNDVLCVVVLKTLATWNQKHRGGERVGLWMPINLRERERPFAGFGNGSGRIRVYRHPARFGSLPEAARSIREQVRWSRENGEWGLPAVVQFLGRRQAWSAPLIRRLMGKHDVDMGTTLFSHAERLSYLDDAWVFPGAVGVELVGQMVRAHPLTLHAATLRGRTFLTFTWDAGVFSESERAAFIEIFEQHRTQAWDALGT